MKSLQKIIYFVLMVGLVGLVGGFSGCSDNEEAVENNQSGVVERGPKRLEIDGDSNGLWWDGASQKLFVADDNNNRILTWSDGAGFRFYADLPKVAEGGAGLGQLVLTDKGEVVVTRFGSGKAGDVAYVDADKKSHALGNLLKERRRIGLTVDKDGNLYDSWFVRLSSGERVGAVGKLTLEGTETIVMDGLKKPVAVLAMGDELFVSDQEEGRILRAPIAKPQEYTVLAKLADPDLLTVGPGNTLFAGSADGNVYRIGLDGKVSVFKAGFTSVRGVAYDADNKRLFVAEHDKDETDGINHAVHILPVD